MVELIRLSQQDSSLSLLLRSEGPRAWLTRTEWHGPLKHSSSQSVTLTYKWTSRPLQCHQVLSWDTLVNFVSQMFTCLGKKLDCTCIAERIFLIVKSDHVFLPHCHIKPEGFRWQGRFSIIENPRCTEKAASTALSKLSEQRGSEIRLNSPPLHDGRNQKAVHNKRGAW